MTRFFVISLIASGVALWSVSVKSAEYGVPVYPNVGSVYAPPQVWPPTNHGPAISKTLRTNPQPQSIPAAPPNQGYDWQYQPAPPPAAVVPPRFSYPQQGYYPREGHVPQVPGYEYDFGSGAGTFPPAYPMEGANWRAPRVAQRASSYSAPVTPYFGTFLDCQR